MQSTELRASSISEYAHELAKNSIRILPGSGETYWVKYESGAMVRIPNFHVTPPEPGEVQRVLWRSWVPLVGYLLVPDNRHPANSWHYFCRNSSYSVDKLSKAARRDIRRAQRNLQFGPVDWPTLLANGFEPYRDTRTRVGLSDSTWAGFKNRFEMFSRNPCHCAFGAWKDNVLVAFMTLMVIDDWVEIEGSFSSNAHLGMCPNDGLAYYVVEYFLVQRGFRLVSYGLSSIQQDSEKGGLHAYKKKVGFEPEPVHRAFVPHPMLRPVANRLTLWGMETLLRYRPGERRLRKACGVLSQIIRGKDTSITFDKKKHIE